MSLQIENQELELTVKMGDLRLSKYAFGIKVKNFISMLGWTGMILSIIGGLSSLIPITIPIERFDCSSFDKLPCGLIVGFGAFSLALTIIWFCFNFFLKKKNNQDDVVKVTEILKINCYIQGSLTIIYSVILVLFFDVIIHLRELDYILYPVISLPIILAILLIIGVATRKPKLLLAHISISVAVVIIFIVFILGYTIYISFFQYNITGLPFITGLLASFGIGLFSIYWIGYVVVLQAIMTKMNQVISN